MLLQHTNLLIAVTYLLLEQSPKSFRKEAAENDNSFTKGKQAKE